MKRFLYSAALILFAGAVSCSTYSVKKELNESSALKGSGKIGVAVRVSLKGRIQRDEFIGSISKELPSYRHKRAVELLVDLPSSATEFMDESDSFYQQTSGEFKPYKSLGTLKSFLRNHESEIKTSMEKSGCDLLAIYEVYTVASVEMQMMKFTSVLAVVDRNLDVVYLDHQSDIFDSETTDLAALKAEIVTNVTDRFIEKMKEFNWLSDL